MRHLKTILLICAVLAGLFISFYLGKNAQAPAPENLKPATPQAGAQTKPEEGDTQVEPNVNTQEFKLTASNVSCTTNTVNGVTSRSCTGNIRVIPRAQADMEPGLYKINENTKLLHSGQSEDLTNLHQLAQANTIVRLRLAEGSNDTLAEISY